jgi:hypothetical protein
LGTLKKLNLGLGLGVATVAASTLFAAPLLSRHLVIVNDALQFPDGATASVEGQAVPGVVGKARKTAPPANVLAKNEVHDPSGAEHGTDVPVPQIPGHSEPETGVSAQGEQTLYAADSSAVNPNTSRYTNAPAPRPAEEPAEKTDTGNKVRLSLEMEGRYFPKSPLYEDQSDQSVQPGITLRASHAFRLGDRVDLVFSGLASFTAHTERPRHADATEAYVGYRGEHWNMRVGVLTERWGVLDAYSPVNQFNQVDLLADYEGSIQLGQPGAALSVHGEKWMLTLVGASYMPKRRMGEGKDRFRVAGIPLGSSWFEHGDEFPTWGARFLWRHDGIDIGLSHFRGHSREPEFSFELTPYGPLLHPEYRIVEQTGLELQAVLGNYVLRGETARRSGQTGGSFTSSGVGVERMFYAFSGTKDLSLYTEYYYDDRPETAPVNSFDNDLVLGAKLILNDAASTEFGVRAIRDLEVDSTLLDFTWQRRLWKDTVLGAKWRSLHHASKDPALSSFRRDNTFTLSLSHYF